jgi:hypothetical protein
MGGANKTSAAGGSCPTYRVHEWATNFENNRSRELKRLDWVPIPNRMDGDGYTELLDHPAGASHLGAWLALVQVASRCDPRGTLLRDGKRPHDFASLARISRIPLAIFEEAIPRFLQIGWLEITPNHPATLQDGATISHDPAPKCDNPAPGCLEGKGMEWKGTEEKHSALAAASERMYAKHPKKRNLVLIPGALVSAVSKAPDPNALLGEIEAAHTLWSVSPDWTKESGRYCPKLDEWISDRGWTVLPERQPEESSVVSTMDPETARRIRERRRQEAEANRPKAPVYFDPRSITG